ADDSYTPHSALIDLCADALGLTVGYVPPDIDDLAPPGPLEWGNASAAQELLALCARIGHTPILAASGSTLHVQRLPQGGEPVSIAGYASIAEPYELGTHQGQRARTIVVTSGETRTVCVCSRDGNNLEWVWRDPKTGRWLNGTETASAYPGTVAPNSLTAWRGGPPKDSDGRSQFNRVYRALRITPAEERLRIGRLTSMTVRARDGETDQGERVDAVIHAIAALPGAPGEWVRSPASGSTLVRFDGASIVPQDGVIVLPRDVAWIKLPAETGGYGDATAYAAGDLVATFAYESNEGNVERDYYCAAWSASIVSDEVVLTRLTGADLTAAINDPLTLKVQAPFLRRVVERVATGDVGTPVNDSVLDQIAEQIATYKAAGGLIRSGQVELRGMVNALPGFSPEAISQVAWDVRRGVTVLTINQHDVPRSAYESLERAASRSVATGLSRYARPGTAAALDDVQAGGAQGTATIAQGSAARGAERTVTPRGGGAAAPGVEDLAGDRGAQLMIRITGSTSAGTNKWTYQWEEVRWTGSAWAAVANGRTHTTSGVGLNGCEAANSGSGRQGNGVLATDLTGDCLMQPITAGVVVHAAIVGPLGSTRALFHAPNGVGS
ncbi:MAG: hypothetical protein SFZ24_07105, partial [Planctomycetota bacterium]|nr:hypothetical protein [Planctomycetota bacterium]